MILPVVIGVFLASRAAVPLLVSVEKVGSGQTAVLRLVVANPTRKTVRINRVATINVMSLAAPETYAVTVEIDPWDKDQRRIVSRATSITLSNEPTRRIQ